MTGDGVNDSLALEAGACGCGDGYHRHRCGQRGFGYDRLDDNFATIVTAIEQGRVVYHNLVKVVKFLLAGNLSELLLIVLAIVIGLPIPLLPTQIL